TFYLLSDGLSIQHRRITKPCFRTGSTDRSRRQAPLYLYARCPIADRAEGTFGLLRYLFGGDRPSQTAHLSLSTPWLAGPGYNSSTTRLVFQGSTHGRPEEPGHRLPATLRMTGLSPILSYSKGSRGLSV